VSQDLQQARYDKLVRRVGALYGGGSKVTEVLAELFPVLDVENVPAELLVLNGWDMANAASERPANVATGQTHQLFNPADSGRIAVLTHLQLQVTVATIINMGVAAAQIAGTNVSGRFRDTRNGAARATALVTRTLDGSTANADARYRVIAREQLDIRDMNGLYVLAPGTGFTVTATEVNSLITLNWFWRERIAEPSELLFP
jgi:hypothetical protein